MPFDRYRPNPFNNLINSYMKGTKFTAEERWETVLGTGQEYEATDYESWETRLSNLEQSFIEFHEGGKSGHINNQFYDEWNETLNTGSYLNSNERKKVLNWFAEKITEAKQTLDEMGKERSYSIKSPVRSSNAERQISDNFSYPYGPVGKKRSKSKKFNTYFPLRHGYTMQFNSGVAFQIPEFWRLDNYLTYYIWNKYPKLRTKVVYIWPLNDAFPDWLEMGTNHEQKSNRYANGVLWETKPNIAFWNQDLERRVPSISASSWTVNFAGFNYESSLPTFSNKRRVRIVSKISHLPDKFNPTKGKMKSAVGGTPFPMRFVISMLLRAGYFKWNGLVTHKIIPMELNEQYLQTYGAGLGL